MGSGAICEVDVDEVFQTEMHLSADPANGDRKRVLHITSNDDDTRDYGCSVISFIEREITLGEVVDNRMVYDFYEGPQNARAAPDESFVIVQNDKGVFVAYQHRRVPGKRKWRTYEFGNAIEGEGSKWRAKQLSAEDLKLREKVDLANVDFAGRDVNFAMRVIEQIIEFLRDLQAGQPIPSPLEAYGRDAQLLGVAIGKGWINQNTVNDVYYDELVLTFGDETSRLEWPVAVSMEFEFKRDKLPQPQGQVPATLSFEQPERGLTLKEIDAESITLMPFTSIAPLEEVEAVQPEKVNVRQDSVRLIFEASQIAELVGEGEQTLLLTGSFVDDAVPRPASFLGRSSIQIG